MGTEAPNGGKLQPGLPAGGNCRWQQTLVLRQAGVGKALKEKGSKDTLSMNVIMIVNTKGCNFEVF